MLEELYTASPPHGLRNGPNAAWKNSTPEDSGRYSSPSDARSLAAMRLVAVSIISRPTASVCAIRSSTPKACALPPALSKPDAKWPLVRASNVPACTGPSKAPTPSLLSVVQNSGPHDPSLSWRAPAGGRKAAYFCAANLGLHAEGDLADAAFHFQMNRG